MLTERQDYMQREIERAIHDIDQFAKQVVKAKEFIANLKADRLREAREGQQDVRAD